MAGLTEELLKQLQGAPEQQMANSIGASTSQVQSAIGAALPMLMGALGKNAQQESGAAALLGALQKDHGGASSSAGGFDVGSLLGGVLGAVGGSSSASSNPLGGMLGGVLNNAIGSALSGGNAPSAQLNGSGILGHILGSNQSRAEAGLAQASGLSAGQSSQLLKMLAPMVMGYLGKQVSGSNMSASGLSQLLGQERASVQQSGGLGANLLGAVLDQNGDGKFDMSDVLKLGAGFLANRK